LDELLRAVEGARTELVSMEKMSDEELAKLQKEFERLSKRKAPQALKKAGA
jgi:low affinity Fe/Cu permease